MARAPGCRVCGNPCGRWGGSQWGAGRQGPRAHHVLSDPAVRGEGPWEQLPARCAGSASQGSRSPRSDPGPAAVAGPSAGAPPPTGTRMLPLAQSRPSGKRTRGRTSVSLPPLFITDSSNPSRRPLLSGSPTATPAGAPEGSSAHPRGGVAADAGAHLPAPTRARRTTSGPGLLRPPGVKGPGAHCVLTVVGAQC